MSLFLFPLFFPFPFSSLFFFFLAEEGWGQARRAPLDPRLGPGYTTRKKWENVTFGKLIPG